MVEMDDEKRQEIARHYRDHPEEPSAAASNLDERIKDALNIACEILPHL